MRSDEGELVRRCLAGDHQAFDTLYDRHAARVYHLLRRLSGNEAEAEDLTQETFLAAYRNLVAWRGEAAFGTWLCGIAYRLHAKAQRSRAQQQTERLDDETALPAPEGDPLSFCLRVEMAERIEAAIVELPPLFRAPFVLVKVEGLSYREAAQWLEVPIGTLQWRLWRAVSLLKSRLRDLHEIAAEDTFTPPPDRPECQGRTPSSPPLDPQKS
jgi:RNA polymerase sigma-70 factor (ECF subfamily)